MPTVPAPLANTPPAPGQALPVPYPQQQYPQPAQPNYYQQPAQPNYYQQPAQPNYYQQPMPQQAPQMQQQMPPYPYQQMPIQQVNVVMNSTPAPVVPVVVMNQKNVGISLLLTFLFGPLGMFYSTVSGALIMLVVSVVLAAFTLGFSVLITWPICMIWGAIAASSHNKTIITRM